MSIDLSVPEGIPHTGIFTSDQGFVSILEEQIIRVSQATVSLGNTVGVYRENHKRSGITYSGLQRVDVSITRAFINAVETKLVTGDIPVASPGPDDFFAGPRAISIDQLHALILKESSSFSQKRYPPRVNCQLIINENQFPQTAFDEKTLSSGGLQRFTVYNAIATNHVLAWDSRGLITSGPMNLVGSAVKWTYAPVVVPSPPTLP